MTRTFTLGFLLGALLPAAAVGLLVFLFTDVGAGALAPLGLIGLVSLFWRPAR